MKRDNSIELVNAKLCYFSLKATGIDPAKGAEIYEIACARCRGNDILETYESYIKTERPIAETKIRVKRIDIDKLSAAPSVKDVLYKTLNFIDNDFVVTDNISFVIRFINFYLEKLDRDKFRNFTFGLNNISRKLFHHKVFPTLKALAERLDVQVPEFRTCMDEAILMKTLFLEMAKLLKYEKITTTVALREYQGRVFLYTTDEKDERIRDIQKCINNKHVLEMEYYSPWTEKSSERQIDPYEIRKKNLAFYLIGYCHKRREVRFFRIKYIKKFRVLLEKFKKPESYDLPDFFKEG